MEQLALSQFVRPRIRSESGESWLLEDEIAARLVRGDRGELWITGARGAGKRSALAYLRLRFAGEERLQVGRYPPEDDRLLYVGGRTGLARGPKALELAPWSRDEWIEYLLARHPARCASVMQRLSQPERYVDLAGRPLLWAAVLDELARDENLPDEFEALRVALQRKLGTIDMLARARMAELNRMYASDPRGARELENEELLPFAAWLENPAVRHLLAAEALVLLLMHELGAELPHDAPKPELLRALRPLLEVEPRATIELRRVLVQGPADAQPCAASLLHLTRPDAIAEVLRAQAPPRELPLLRGAQLEGLRGAELQLRKLNAVGARLVGARLDDADLSGALLQRAELSRCSLRRAVLTHAELARADLRASDLSEADLKSAQFDHAHLELAVLRGAQMQAANLRGAVLLHASFEGADLRYANLEASRVVGATFEGADLRGAHLNGLDLREARLATTLFSSAGLVKANLESQSIRAPDFSKADLDGALLSATRFPSANFQQANLRNTGLAWVAWEGANLFGADLTGASFHLGSSRSGLVMNAPASWGTRTGFYTDEHKEQGFKSPEEIRKADLRGADLRAAKILGTDFYLVDLRGAIYTPDQEQHLRASGAILGSKR